MFPYFLAYAVLLSLMYLSNMLDNTLGTIIFWVLFVLSTIVVYNTFMEIRDIIISYIVNFMNRNVDVDEWKKRNTPSVDTEKSVEE